MNLLEMSKAEEKIATEAHEEISDDHSIFNKFKTKFGEVEIRQGFM